MFFRGRQPEASIWRRFRVSADGFTFAQEDDHYTAHVVANAERVVDLFYTLTRAAAAGSRRRASTICAAAARGKAKPSRCPTCATPWRGSRSSRALWRRRARRSSRTTISSRSIHISSCSSTRGPTAGCICSRGKGSRSSRACTRRAGRRIASTFPAAPDLVNAVTAAAERLGLQPA